MSRNFRNFYGIGENIDHKMREKYNHTDKFCPVPAMFQTFLQLLYPIPAELHETIDRQDSEIVAVCDYIKNAEQKVGYNYF